MNNIIKNLTMSASPHIRTNNSTRLVMQDVLIALLPATIGSVVFFGVNALIIIIVSILSAVLSEFVWQKATKQAVTINDLSAAVTGLLIAFNLPPTVPIYIPIVGSVFAIIIVKQLFGGIGHNFMNPALSARVMLMLSFGASFAVFAVPGTATPSMIFSGIDVVSKATPLALIRAGNGFSALPISAMFFGNIGGSLGETSALLLLIGGIYLVIKKVISVRIPVASLVSIMVMAIVFGGSNGLFSGGLDLALAHVLSGGALLGSIFMATDYSSSPLTSKGQIIFGAGIGVLTMVIRLWGATPEGMSYAVLIMNAFAPLIDHLTIKKSFGEQVNKVA